MNLFISYSHVDENYMKNLNTHVVMLERNKVITSWYDRKIIAGQEWEPEISENLEKSQLVLMLISPEFLESNYCYEVEMKRAMEMHDSGDAIVIPVIIRACDWKETEFGKLQALPENAEAIAQWSDQDEAWQNVVTGIKETISLMEKIMSDTPVQEVMLPATIAQNFDDWLNDTDIVLKHRRVDAVKLDDIFVLPDLKMLVNNMDDISIAVCADDVIEKNTCALIFGDEQSGKTAMCKHYYKKFVNMGWSPIYINGRDIKSSNIQSLVKRKAAEQYVDMIDYGKAERRVIIIDDYADCALNFKYQDRLIDSLKDNFEKVIIFTNDSYEYVVPEIESFEDYSHSMLLNFGNVKRTELIEKWVSMGIVEQIEDSLLIEEVDEIKLRINSLTRGGILPPKPIYLLTLLQMFESVGAKKLDLTSYGHCYQYLIYQALEKARVKSSDVEKYLNFMTELACTQYRNEGLGLSDEELKKFHEEYEKRFLSIELKKVISDLVGSGLLCHKDDLLKFKYSYIYYFFAGKNISEMLSNDESAKSKILELLENLHREDCANIIIFITHHTKDDWVLDEIQISLMELFSENCEAKLEVDSLEFLLDFINKIPGLVIEHRKVDIERKKHDAKLDEIEKGVAHEKDINKELDGSNILARINRAFKGMEVVGQVIRNRHGSLSKEKLEELATQGYGVGLRFLDFFINMSEDSREEIIKLIERRLKENPSITNEKLGSEAKNIYMAVTYGAIYGILNKVCMSIGSKEAEEIYREIERKNATPSVKLINQAIYMQFNKDLDIKTIKSLANEFSKNPTCARMLREMVIRHIYMFPVKYTDKQKIAETLNISVDTQLKLGMQKKFKA